MDRRRAAGFLLALAACVATATAAPTASNHTALDLYDGAPDGCYYNFQHYGEGDRIMTNEPCLNCTCHNRMLMCYLRVCPFTKPIGQDCTIEKRADQCCPIVTCPDVPVDLLTSTTTSPAEYGPTGMGKLDKFGCSINGRYFPEGSKVPPTPNKPCEHCYCIRNMTTCVMQECTLHVDGCTPIYHKDVCCPVRYSCDHPEDEMPLLDDMSTTVRPTQGFLLTTTTVSPVTQMSQDCVYDNRIFPDGALIKTEKACDHCYCMKGDIVCVVQECGTPMENEGKNCTALSPREGVCCPDTYICEGDESSTATYESEDFTTLGPQEKLTTLSPPRRTSSEGSGYRNEPDEVPYTELPETESETEGSGEDEEQKPASELATEKYTHGTTDEILTSTEETHEYIPLTTMKPKEETKPEVSIKDEGIFNEDFDKTTESQQRLSSTTDYSTKDSEEQITDKIITDDMGSGEIPQDVSFKPDDEISETSTLLVTEDNVATTEIIKQTTVTTGLTERDSSESLTPVTSVPFVDEEKTVKPLEEEITSDDRDNITPMSPIESERTTTVIPEKSTKLPSLTESSEIDIKDTEHSTLTTLHTPSIGEQAKETTESPDENVTTDAPEYYSQGVNLDTQHHSPSTSAPSDDEFVTTESQDLDTNERKETEHFEPQHVTASTPMLEEIEKETTEYTKPESIPTISTSHDTEFNILDTTTSNILIKEDDKKDIPELSITEEPEDLSGTTTHPVFSQQEVTEKISEGPVDTSVKEDLGSEVYSPATISDISGTVKKTTTEISLISSEYNSEQYESSSTSLALEPEEPTTEPDKGLNTIPSDAIDEQVSVSPEVQKTTVGEEKISTETGLDNKFGSDREGIISPTTSDSSAAQQEFSLLTTESAFRKEDYSPTDTEIGVTSITETAAVTEEVTSTLSHDHTISTGSDADNQDKTDTTSEPKYTESIEKTTSDKGTSSESPVEVTTPKASVDFVTEIVTTVLPLHEKETTTVNQEDNEIFNEPRIPGEGACLLNGVTYTNESAVPSSNKCQSGCKCVSSIIKCDPIICSPPLEYMHNMNNCETIYDTPDACCPTYICDHKTETIPPQSHSQMSGTEAPVISPVHCRGDECEIGADKIHQNEPSKDCESGSCTSPSDESKEPSNPPDDNMPEKPIIEHQGCVGDECTQVLCSVENGCQPSSVQPCEGEKCDTLPEVMLPPKIQPCALGEDCKDINVPPKECAGGNCDIPSTEIQESYPKETCTEKEGCADLPKLPEEECKDDHCRRKDNSPLDHHIPVPCEGPNCKQFQTETESSTTPNLEQTSQNIIETEQTITTTEISKHIDASKSPEDQDIASKLPEMTSDETISTVSDNIQLVTEQVETITKLSELTNAQEDTNSDIATEKNKPMFTESPELPVSTETLYTDEDASKFITQEEAIKLTTEKLELEVEKISDVTETAKIDTSEEQVTDSVEQLKPEDKTPIISVVTEPGVLVTESQDSSKPSDDKEQNENATDNLFEISTDLPKSEGGMKTPDDIQNVDITTPFAEKTNTELSGIYTTKVQDVTKAPETTEQSKSTDDFKNVESITELPQISEPAITVSDELTEVKEITKEISEYDMTTTPAKQDDVPNVTVTPKDTEDDNTVKVDKESEPPILSSEVPAIVQSEHIPSTGTEVSTTDPSKTSITEPTQSSDTEASDYGTATEKILEKPSTEPNVHYTEEHYETTISQEIDITSDKLDENVTVPPKTQTESQLVTKIPEEVKQDVTESNTKIGDSSVTTTTSFEDQFLEQSSSSLPPKYDTEDKILTHSPEETDIKDSTLNIPESETSSTLPEILEEDKATTPEIPVKPEDEPPELYPIEQQEGEKLQNNQDVTTDTLEELTTEPYKLFDINTDIPKLPVETVQEDTTPKITQVTEQPLSFITGSHDMPKLTEESTATIQKSEGTTELPKIDEEVTHEFIPATENSIVEDAIPETVTTAQELESVEFATLSSSDGSKITTQPEDISKETTDSSLYSGSKPSEPTMGEGTMSAPTDHDFSSTATTLTSEKDQMQQETQKPDLDSHTISSLSPDLEDVSKPETTEQPDKTIQEDVSQQIDYESQVPTESDELRTTQSEINDSTTTKPTEMSPLPQDVNEKIEHPEIHYTETQEQSTEKLATMSQDTTTKELLASTVTVIPSLTSTEKTAPLDTNLEEESGTDTPHLSPDDKPSIEESYTEGSISKYSSPEPLDESTKTYVDENTVQPTDEDSKEPHISEDGFIQSLVTEKYDTQTKPSDFEKESHTQTSTQLTSATADDVTITPQQDDVKVGLTSPQSTSMDTIQKESDNRIVPTTEHEKPMDEEIRTESPIYIDESIKESTTHKKTLPEDSEITQEPSTIESTELATSSTPVHKITTQRSDKPLTDASTETSVPDTLFTEKNESSSTDKPSIDTSESLTGSTYATETSEIKQTESVSEVTKLPDDQIQTEKSETITEDPEIALGTKSPTLMPVLEEQDSDEKTSEALKPSKKQPDTTTETISATEIKQESSTNLPEEAVYTDSIKVEDVTPLAGEQTTESALLEVYTEKQPEIITTVTPEIFTSVEEYVTTRKQLELEIHQTTVSSSENIDEISTRPTPSSEPQDIDQKPQSEEQSIPVVVSETEKTITPEDSVAQTERVVPASEKPIQETTAPEEEFIVATLKTTTVNAEDTTTLSADRIATPTAATEAPITTILDEKVVTTSDAIVTVAPESASTESPASSITPEAETPGSKAPDMTETEEHKVQTSTEFDESVTKASDQSITSASKEPEIAPKEPISNTPTAAPVTVVPEAPKTPELTEAFVPEEPMTNAPELSVTAESDAPTTNTPELPANAATEVLSAPELPGLAASETPITNAPDLSVPTDHDASVTDAPELTASAAPITNVPEILSTAAPEVHFTNAPKVPETTAPELPIPASSEAPELPKPVSTEAQPNDDALTPEEEGSFAPSGGTSGYGQEPDYVEEDQTFGPGTCRYGGKVYVSAQQIPRDDPCDFCFCFRSDIICLQQSCPPPIHGCHEEPIQGFCCPRYECPVSMATTVNVTTTTTTTTTTLPPHFPTHSYKGSVQKRGCQIKGQTYKVGEVVRASSGPCLHCTCGGDGQMKCDPKVCTPEPMLRQMIAAAVSAKRRR